MNYSAFALESSRTPSYVTGCFGGVKVGGGSFAIGDVGVSVEAPSVKSSTVTKTETVVIKTEEKKTEEQEEMKEGEVEKEQQAVVEEVAVEEKQEKEQEQEQVKAEAEVEPAAKEWWYVILNVKTTHTVTPLGVSVSFNNNESLY